MTPTQHDRAVVLGGSIAGLLAARVLADDFAEVLVIDRDALGPEAAPRRGTPQARHLHGLLARGLQVLEELFPGLTAELVAGGAPVGDMLGNTRLTFGGHRFRQAPSGLTALCVSRPTLEAAVRRRVVALPAVRLLGERDVVGLTASRDNRRVVGARVIGRADGSAEEQLPADVVRRRDRAWLTATDLAGVPGLLTPAAGAGPSRCRLRQPPLSRSPRGVGRRPRRHLRTHPRAATRRRPVPHRGRQLPGHLDGRAR